MNAASRPAEPPRRTLAGVLFVLGPAAFLTGVVIAIARYGPPGFQFVSNSISDLQAVHCGEFMGHWICSPAEVAANAGVFVAGLCLSVGTILGWTTVTRAGTLRSPGYLFVLAGIGAAANAFTPEDVTLVGDVLTAFIVFVAANLGLVLLGRTTAGSSRWRGALSYPAILGEFGFLALLCWSLGLSGPLGSGIEWLVVAPILAWMTVTGILWTAGRTGVPDPCPLVAGP